MIFVDTNYFLRLLLADHHANHTAARILFDGAAKGKIKLFTSVLVFFEVYWVLSSFNNKKRADTIFVLENILNLECIRIENRPLLETALQLFTSRSIDLEDAYNLAYARKYGAKHFATFDKKLLSIWRRKWQNKS